MISRSFFLIFNLLFYWLLIYICFRFSFCKCKTNALSEIGFKKRADFFAEGNKNERSDRVLVEETKKENFFNDRRSVVGPLKDEGNHGKIGEGEKEFLGVKGRRLDVRKPRSNFGYSIFDVMYCAFFQKLGQNSSRDIYHAVKGYIVDKITSFYYLVKKLFNNDGFCYVDMWWPHLLNVLTENNKRKINKSVSDKLKKKFQRAVRKAVKESIFNVTESLDIVLHTSLINFYHDLKSENSGVNKFALDSFDKFINLPVKVYLQWVWKYLPNHRKYKLYKEYKDSFKLDSDLVLSKKVLKSTLAKFYGDIESYAYKKFGVYLIPQKLLKSGFKTIFIKVIDVAPDNIRANQTQLINFFLLNFYDSIKKCKIGIKDNVLNSIFKFIKSGLWKQWVIPEVLLKKFEDYVIKYEFVDGLSKEEEELLESLTLWGKNLIKFLSKEEANSQQLEILLDGWFSTLSSLMKKSKDKSFSTNLHNLHSYYGKTNKVNATDNAVKEVTNEQKLEYDKTLELITSEYESFLKQNSLEKENQESETKICKSIYLEYLNFVELSAQNKISIFNGEKYEESKVDYNTNEDNVLGEDGDLEGDEDGDNEDGDNEDEDGDNEDEDGDNGDKNGDNGDKNLGEKNVSKKNDDDSKKKKKIL